MTYELSKDEVDLPEAGVLPDSEVTLGVKRQRKVPGLTTLRRLNGECSRAVEFGFSLENSLVANAEELLELEAAKANGPRWVGLANEVRRAHVGQDGLQALAALRMLHRQWQCAGGEVEQKRALDRAMPKVKQLWSRLITSRTSGQEMLDRLERGGVGAVVGLPSSKVEVLRSSMDRLSRSIARFAVIMRAMWVSSLEADVREECESLAAELGPLHARAEEDRIAPSAVEFVFLQRFERTTVLVDVCGLGL